MGPTRRRTIASTAGPDAASGSGFSTPGIEIARQSVSDRQHDCESPSCGQRGKRGEQNQAIGISRGGRTTKIHAIVDSKGRPLNFTVTGGQVPIVRSLAMCSTRPGRRWLLQPTRPTTARKYVSRSRMRELCRSSPAAAMPPGKPIVPNVFTGGATKSKTTSAASKIGAGSPHAMTNSPETSLPPQPSSGHSWIKVSPDLALAQGFGPAKTPFYHPGPCTRSRQGLGKTIRGLFRQHAMSTACHASVGPRRADAPMSTACRRS